jgi:hypothetical protein
LEIVEEYWVKAELKTADFTLNYVKYVACT